MPTASAFGWLEVDPSSKLCRRPSDDKAVVPVRLVARVVMFKACLVLDSRDAEYHGGIPALERAFYCTGALETQLCSLLCACISVAVLSST